VDVQHAIIVAGPPRPQRPWPSVGRTPRPLVPLANAPIILHQLRALEEDGIRAVTVVADGALVRPLERELARRPARGPAVTVVACEAGTGVAGALRAAGARTAFGPLLIERTGVLRRGRLRPHLDAFADEELDVLALSVDGDGDGDAGWIVGRRAAGLLRAAGATDADPLGHLAAAGGAVRRQAIDGLRPCDGEQEALLEANRVLLERLAASGDGGSVAGPGLQGFVRIDPTAEVDRSVVRGPAVIGPHARLADAYVGPYTAIGAGATIEGSEVEHSIVMDGAALRFVGARVESSVIGRGARVGRSFSPPAALRLAVGDGALVRLA
jgi:glucose-1-phosphate thymidylyltransferase